MEASAAQKGAYVLRHAHTYTYKYIYQFYILATPLVLSALLRCLKIHKFKLAQGQ